MDKYAPFLSWYVVYMFDRQQCLLVRWVDLCAIELVLRTGVRAQRLCENCAPSSVGLYALPSVSLGVCLNILRICQLIRGPESGVDALLLLLQLVLMRMLVLRLDN